MLASNELVTVIITTFHRTDYLKTCISSIIKQTCTNLEIIVVSDGKDINSERIVKQFGDSRISYYELHHSGLPAVGRNFGISVANGYYVAFCDDDDCWMPTKVEEQVSRINTSSCDIIYCYAILINGEGEMIRNTQGALYRILRVIERHLTRFKIYIYTKSYITFSSIMIKRSIAKDCYFDEDTKLRGSEDYYFILRAIHSCNLCSLEKELVCYRLHNSNISNSKRDGYKRSLRVLHTLRNEKKIKKIFYYTGTLIYQLKLLFTILKSKRNDI